MDKRELYPNEIKSQYKPIKEWRADERPREKLLNKGADTLSDAELLAILISTGTKNISALDLSNFLLERYESLSELANRDIVELQSIKGIGVAKAITLAAAFEITKRIQSKDFSELPTFRSPEDVARYFIPRFRGVRQEQFHVVLLNSANKIIKSRLITEGILNSSLVHPREVFRYAIIESAASLILIHNHPSGTTTPSNEDILVTKKLLRAAEYIDISILDHIIIAGDTFLSFAWEGLLT